MNSAMRREDGFTLMEVIAVIMIIGILSAIGIAALSGARNAGREKACDTDLATLRTAVETYYAKTAPSAYGNERALLDDGLLAQLSSSHDLTVGATQAAADSATNAEASVASDAFYSIKVADAGCGTVGEVVS